MAEANSIQMAKLVSNPRAKLATTERHGRHRLVFCQIASIAAAIGDTIYLGRVPKGARIVSTKLKSAAGTASSTMSIGLRKTADKTVLSATALGAATSIAAAQTTDVTNTGAYTNNGQSYITTEEDDVYATIAGAATPASPGQLISVEVNYVVD